MVWGNKSPAPNYNVEKMITLQYGIANFPLFLYQGKNTLIDYQNAGLITSKMLTKSDKNFICQTQN